LIIFIIQNDMLILILGKGDFHFVLSSKSYGEIPSDGRLLEMRGE